MRPRGEWTRVAALALAVLAFCFLCFAMASLVNSRGWGYDFGAYYGAALRLTAGEGIYQPGTLDEPFRPGPAGLYLYAPPLAILTAATTFTSWSGATILWLVLHMALFVAACAAMPVRREIRLLTFAVAAFSRPVIADLILGNVSILVLFLSVLVWRWVDRPAASIALAAVLSIRPQFGVVMLWSLLRRRFAPVAWTIVAGCVLVAVTLPVVGVETYRDYLTVLANVSRVTGVPNNVDLGSTALAFGLPAPFPTLALLSGYVVAAAAVLFSVRRDRELSIVVTVTATLLLSPLLWDHYLVSVLIPGAFLASRGRSWGLLLPLLGWLPQPCLPFVALAAVVLPFLAPPPGAAHARRRPRPKTERGAVPAVGTS